MKPIFTLMFLGIAGLSSFAQTTLFSENFEAGNTTFTLNTTDVNSTSSGGSTNDWAVNNQYTGGNGAVICPQLGGQIPVTIPNNATQPGGITNAPTSTYMHVTSLAGQSFSINNNTFLAPEGVFCFFPENIFTRMNSDISTVGYNNVSFSFWWQCGGDASNYGEVYYSTNSGSSWTLCNQPLALYNNSANWQQTTIQLPAFNNQATLRFGFRFVTGVSFSAQDPGFGVDEIEIKGSSSTTSITQNPQSVVACDNETVTYSITAQNANTYQWQANQGLGFNNISNGGVYSGATTSTLTITNPNASLNNTNYRCVVTGTGSDTSTQALLTVNTAPNAAFSANTTSGSTATTFTFTVNTPSIGASYSWDFCDQNTTTTTAPTVNHTYTAPGIYNNCVCLTVTASNGCEATTCLPQIAVTTVGVNEEGETISLYPNPATSSLMISGLKAGQTYEIYAIDGRKVKAGNWNNEPISVQELLEGNYVIHISNNEGSQIFSFRKTGF